MHFLPKEIWLLIFKHAFIAESLLFEGFSVCHWWQPIIVEVIESYEIGNNSRIGHALLLNRLPNLTRLEIRNGGKNKFYMATKDLEVFTKLRSLTLNSTYRDIRPLECLLNISTLIELSIKGNISLPISSPFLKRLVIHTNDIVSDMDIIYLENTLESLTLQDTSKVTDIGIKRLTNLTYLTLKSENIKGHCLCELTKLTHLTLSNSDQLTYCSTLTNLKFLGLDDADINHESFNQVASNALKGLSIGSYFQLTKLNISKFENVRYLYIAQLDYDERITGDELPLLKDVTIGHNHYSSFKEAIMALKQEAIESHNNDEDESTWSIDYYLRNAISYFTNHGF